MGPRTKQWIGDVLATAVLLLVMFLLISAVGVMIS